MKFTLLAVAAVAAISGTNAAIQADANLTSSGVKCDYTVVGPSLHALGTPLAKCQTAIGSDYNLARDEDPVTPEQAAAICSKCPEFVKEVIKKRPTWPSCYMLMGGKNQTIASYFDTLVGTCEGMPAETTDTSATNAPSLAVKAAGSGSGAASSQAEVTKAPVVTSAPVPAPSSSGYSVTVGVFAASAVATTVALAL